MKAAAIVRSGAIYGIANVVAAGVPFLLLPVLTRALDPAEYGEVITFFMLVTLCNASAGLGAHSAVGVRWLDTTKGDPRSYTASALVLIFVSTLVTAGLAAVIAPVFGLDVAPELCALSAVVAGATVVQSMRFAIWQSRHEPVRAATLQVTAAVTNVTLSLAGVFILQLGAEGRIYGATVAGVLVALTCAYFMHRSGDATRPQGHDMRALLRFGVPLVPHVLAGAVLTSADRFAVAGQMNTSALGIYGAASQLGLIVNVLADAANKAYIPFLYGMLGQSSAASKLRVVAITYLSIPLWIVTALAVWGVAMATGGLLLGSGYADALRLSLWFMLGGAVNGIYLSISGLFFFSGKTEWISVATMSGAAVALIVAVPLVNRFGVTGGGMTYLLSQLTMCCMAWGLSARKIPMPWRSPLLATRTLLRGEAGAT